MSAAVLALVAGSIVTQGALVLSSRPPRVQAQRPPRVRAERVRRPSMPWLAALVQLATADRATQAAAVTQAAQEVKERSGLEQALQEAATLWHSRQRIAKDSQHAVADTAKALRSAAGDLADEASSRLRADAQAAAGLVHKAGAQALVQVRRSAAEHPLGTIAAAAGIAFALTLLSGRR
ncbi:hypothetical protein [Pseudorhodoferax sp. Leaf267]|uniref:hypothetical protein n=1 Tax=Pseudorhodoferax sp. Leaf267 TaxID=1736316 RepID=UPI0006FB33C9|nr:hypothetical protein [Pseudorhodoferax sp. Leaf267]KQP13137.1 hypothetical protein ASF43_18695 [Pseudorhodoferax sp. Leaf267]